jgi:lipopolysaccharide transport system ATP-binding protein
MVSRGGLGAVPQAVPPEADEGVAAIVVRGIGKAYRLYGKPEDRLKEQLLWRFGRQYGRDFWALSDVSFSIGRGERFGVIGRNGSGKSTLLQIIAGVLAPSSGEVQVRGRVAALLELGSGFNPQFTGRENVVMNATLLGLAPSEIEARYDGIVAFADIGDFIDQPVKTYSSGMLVRLAFAVATAVDADVLLVDEALAVGDVFFRQKCYRRLEELRERGTSVILVSHAMTEVEQFCKRALLLDRGRPLFVGPALEAVNRYYLVEQGGQQEATVAVDASSPVLPLSPVPRSSVPHSFDWPVPDAFVDLAHVTQVTNDWARCTALAVCDGQGRACRHFRQGERAVFFSEFEIRQDIEVPVCGLSLRNDKGTVVHGKSTLEYDSAVPFNIPAGARLRTRQEIALALAVGEYTITPGLAAVARTAYDRRGILTHEQLSAEVVRLCHLPAATSVSVSLRDPGRGVSLLHHGVADLPGSCDASVVDVPPPGSHEPS